MKTKHASRKTALLAALIIVAVIVGGLAAVRLVTGKSLGLRSLAENSLRTISNPFKSIVNGRAITSSNEGNFTNIIFLHHSTGNNLIQQGNMRDLFNQKGYHFWDHGRNFQGLRDPGGTPLRYTYNIPNDNTDPDGLAVLFDQKALPLPLNAFTNLLQHEVIVIKSCFEPANNIRSDEQLEQYKQWYLGMRETMAMYPDRIFIVITTPPINPASTNSAEAARARQYAEWLMSEEFRGGYANIFVFDFFSLLAESDPDAEDYNMLRADYRDGDDSHPNQAANKAIGPVFVEYIVQSIDNYRDIAVK